MHIIIAELSGLKKLNFQVHEQKFLLCLLDITLLYTENAEKQP